MIKKMIIVAGVFVMLGVLLFGTSAVSYVRTSAGYVTESVGDMVPIQFEIERARGMIKDLVPEVRKNMHLIAKEEVRVNRLKEQIDQAEATLQTEEGRMMRLKSDLETAQSVYQYAGRSYSYDQVKTDLANRLKRYKTSDDTLSSWQQMYEARQRSLEAARQKLEGMLASKRQLEVAVENLEARLQMVEAAKATSEYQFDDSRLGQVKELVSNLQNRLEVASNLVAAEARFHDEIPLDEPATEDIIEQVTQYFEEHRQHQPSAEEIVLD
ncbi:MAG: hypothetical protein JXB62_22635 [Pirellulales bacterium]|nr:hypothetical protein [Pirellulales bacterium]